MVAQKLPFALRLIDRVVHPHEAIQPHIIMVPFYAPSFAGVACTALRENLAGTLFFRCRRDAGHLSLSSFCGREEQHYYSVVTFFLHQGWMGDFFSCYAGEGGANMMAPRRARDWRFRTSVRMSPRLRYCTTDTWRRFCVLPGMTCLAPCGNACIPPCCVYKD